MDKELSRGQAIKGPLWRQAVMLVLVLKWRFVHVWESHTLVPEGFMSDTHPSLCDVFVVVC
jgi:hypothetical protein